MTTTKLIFSRMIETSATESLARASLLQRSHISYVNYVNSERYNFSIISVRPYITVTVIVR